jgi:pimeloyl-ACP methyl ester carboxylesterase
MKAPETRYAKTSDGIQIAYQVAGDADIDLIDAPGTVSHLDLDYDFDNPDSLYMWNRFLAFCRYIRFDKRGTGLSDRVTNVASLEERTDDIRAVMDAAGSERAAIVGVSEGGSMAMLFAATYPERTRALIVWAGQATYLRTPDTPWGIPRNDYQRLVDDLAEHGVSESYIRGGGAGFGDEISDDAVRELVRYFQAGASPASIAALERMNMEIDIRDILPSIQVPTLIVNATHDPISPIEGARYLAERIPNVRLFEYEGNTHVPATREGSAMILDEIEEFVTGTRPPPPMDRVLTTVLFTDIVDSTKRAARLGDAEWKRLLGRHDALARGRIERFGGRYVDGTGDGLLATFDGPARAINCAKELVEAVGALGLEIRAGAHTGEVELVGDAVRGLAVHMGARVAALAGASEVWVSSTVKDLSIGSGLAFEDAGEHVLKGVPDRWRLYRVAA